MWQEEMQIEQIDQAGVTQASLTKLELKVHKNHNLVLVLVGFWQVGWISLVSSV